MRFNWKKFLQQHGIDYVENGRNQKRGEIGIQCPWCGESDQGYHMGLNNEKGWFACWRSDSHRGKRPEILVQKLLQCTRDQAKQIVGKPIVETSDFDRKIQSLLQSGNEKDKPNGTVPITLPDHFKPIGKSKFAKPFKDYLKKRGFKNPEKLSQIYDIRYCLTGYWRNRLIIPVWVEGELVTWTSRTINPKDELRYITLSPNREIEGHTAPYRVTDSVFPYDNIKNQMEDLDTLFVVEGQFDALKLDYFGKPYHRAVCVFGSNPSQVAVNCITKLVEYKKPEKVVAMMDDIHLNMKVQSALSHLNAQQHTLQYKDPGDLTQDEVEDLIDDLYL